MEVSIAIVLDTRRVKKENLYPVKLRVTFNRKQEYYPTIYDLTQEDYNKFSAPRISEVLQKVRASLLEVERNAATAVKAINPFEFDCFEKEFIKNNPLFKERKKKAEKKCIENQPSELKQQEISVEFDFSPYEERFPIFKEESPAADYIAVTFTSYIKNLLMEGRIGTALSYRDSYTSLKQFRGNVPFSAITRQYLFQFERWMIDDNKSSKATVGIKLRSLRAVFNEAIDQGLVKADIYPFGKKKYKIPTAKKAKKSLERKEVQCLYEFEPEEEHIQRAKAYWFFCYFGNGMNPKDLAYLKYENIDGEFLHFIRAKTERSMKDDPIVITAYINEDMQAIIEKWGNKDRRPDNYIFPVLDASMNLMEQYSRVRTLTKFITDGMVIIGEDMELSRKPNNMVCRHSYATHSKESGATTEYIKESLGHASLTTTEIYLGDYGREVKKEFSGRLLAFKSATNQNDTALKAV
ncbi:site-specific integrase [Niabella sp.]|uniref:tyrosine-type recombinase/integrase n=1 Tax=Niabella sp. TaxID=1962976 RepID=UPI00260E769D|nr:site-specific integrase [Niabella sp.]